MSDAADEYLLEFDLPGLARQELQITLDGDALFLVGSVRSLRPDLVITDLHLPGLDGAETTRLLKHRPDPPIIFVVTSDDRPEARSRSLAAGADAFLVKSANLAPQLLSTIPGLFSDGPEDNENSRHLCESLATVE